VSFKNEYLEGEVHYTPRPKTTDLLLELTNWRPPPSPSETFPKTKSPLLIRPLQEEDWPQLPEVFFSAFRDQQPLYCWNQPAAKRASRCIMEWTRRGGDGDPLRNACFVALSPAERAEQNGELQPCGAAIVSLVPVGHVMGARESDSFPHPQDPSRRVLPHLDWMFVARWMKRRGVGTLLLTNVVRALLDNGFTKLASTFVLEDLASMRWHWRNGFVLPPRDVGFDLVEPVDAL
jgi:hypothetical protein